MSDAVDYLHAHAVSAICKARRTVWQIKASSKSGRANLSALVKEAAVAPNLDYPADFRAARQVENRRSFGKASVVHLLKIRHPHQAILAGERKGLVAVLSLSDSEYPIIAGIVN